MADEVRKNELPGDLEAKTVYFKRMMNETAEAIKNCNKTMFDDRLAKLKQTRQDTFNEYIKERESLHFISLKYYEHEAAIRGASPNSSSTGAILAAIVSKLGVSAANGYGAAGTLINSTLNGTAVAAESVRCHPMVAVITLIPSFIKITSEVWNIGTILLHRDKALEMLELKLYYEHGVIPKYKAKIKTMDEAIQKLSGKFSETAFHTSKTTKCSHPVA